MVRCLNIIIYTHYVIYMRDRNIARLDLYQPLFRNERNLHSFPEVSTRGGKWAELERAAEIEPRILHDAKILQIF